MLTPETTNANAEAQQMPGGRIKNWAKKNDQFLLGATTTGIGAAVGTAVFAALTRPPPNGIDPEILDRVHDQTVTVLVKAVDKDGNVITFETTDGGETEILWHGSATFLEETGGRLLVTAAHVADNDLETLPPHIMDQLPDGTTLKFYIQPNGGEHAGQMLEVKTPSSAVNAENDIAILDLGHTTSYTGVVFAPPNSVELGQTVYGFGTPADVLHAGSLKKATISALDGHRLDKDGNLVEEATDHLFQMDGLFHGGHSGMSIFDAQGRFLGVATHRDMTSYGESTITFATDAEQVEALKVSYMKTPEFLQGGTSPTYQVYPDISGTTDTDADELRQHLENDDEFFDSIPTGSGSHWKGGTKGPGNGNRELSEKWIDDVDLSASVPTGVLPPPPDDGPAPFFKDIPDFIVQNGGFSPQSAAEAILQNTIPPGTPNVDADGGILACILEALEL